MMYKTYGLKMYAVMLMTGKKLLDTFFAEKEATGSIPKATSQSLEKRCLQTTARYTARPCSSPVFTHPIYGAIQQFADLLLPDDEDDFDTIVRNHVNEGWYKGDSQSNTH